VIAQGADDENSWLALEWLDLVALAPASAATLGAALAAQHRIGQRTFGWQSDNFIGATPQRNTPSDDWLAFWRQHRLHAQLRLAAANRLPSRMIDRGERLAADCEAFFRVYAPGRSLLHGDLWGGNASSLPDGTPVVFDPAVYVGDREADVAMTELFGGFPRDFLSAYRAHWPLDDGYTVRRDFYNLYHVLNHANLFAGDYVRQSGDAIEKLLAEIA
jgi:fructosamine-3-kinase